MGTFTQLGKQFEAAHPGDHGEVQLRAEFWPGDRDHQRRAGRRVRLGRARRTWTRLSRQATRRSPHDFAKNTAEIAVPPTNPGDVSSVNDLSKPAVKVALCQPQVPCGVVAGEVFKNAGITVKPVTLQPDVKSTLTQVELGSVDAGRGLRDRRDGRRQPRSRAS